MQVAKKGYSKQSGGHGGFFDPPPVKSLIRAHFVILQAE